MPKIVSITSRRESIGGKMYGKGEFEFDNATAKALVSNGKGKIIKDLGGDDSIDLASSDVVKKHEFLQLVRENVAELFEIISDYAKDQSELERSEFENQEQVDVGSSSSGQTEKIEENAGNLNAGNASDNKTENDQGQTSDDSDDETDKSEEGKEAGGTEIPERFPSKDKLEEAGFKTLESIPRTEAELFKAGLSERSAKAVEGRLTELIGEAK